MKKLTMELEIEKNKDNHEFIYALQEAIRQIENGYKGGDLRNEGIKQGYWIIKEE